MAAADRSIDLSLVLPCYNEQAHLEKNVREVVRVLEILGVRWELILVDDCSTDSTRLLIDRLVLELDATFGSHRIQKILHDENQGRGAAVLSGIAASSGSIVGFIDIDLEVAADFIAPCYQLAVAKEADLVIGRRTYRVRPGIVARAILSKGYSWLARLVLGIPRDLDSESGFKFFRRAALEPYLGTFVYRRWFWDTEVVSRYVNDGRRILTIDCIFERDRTKRSTVRLLPDSLDYLRCLFSYRFSLTHRVGTKSLNKQMQAGESRR